MSGVFLVLASFLASSVEMVEDPDVHVGPLINEQQLKTVDNYVRIGQQEGAKLLTGGKILTDHSVRSVRMVLDMIERHLPRNRGVAVLHWFTGDLTTHHYALWYGAKFVASALVAASSPAWYGSAVIPLPLRNSATFSTEARDRQ